MKIVKSSEFSGLMKMYAQRDDTQKMYENYLMLYRELKWYHFGRRKWYKHRLIEQRKILEGWDLLISINARRLVKLIKDEAE